MPLDPLSALSVAASVVQFIDFAGEIVSKGRELYKSASGSLRENEHTETVIRRLHYLTENLKSSLQDSSRRSQNSPQSPIVCLVDELQDRQRQELEETLRQDDNGKKHELQLQEICNECAAVSSELLKYMKELKVSKGQEHRKWKSFRQALKSVWSKDGVDDIARRLSALRRELDTHVLVLVRAKVQAISIT